MRYIITGGGTGGHIFSAIATAKAIKKIDTDAVFVFVGANDYMEKEIVPRAGYDFIGMDIHRMNRFQKWKNYILPYEILKGMWQSYRLIKKFNPHAVVGTGGFATGPVLFTAQLMKIPTFIQEHNAYPGITNRLLAKNATRIHTAFKSIENYFDKNKILLTGNPVRDEFYQIPPSKESVAVKFGFKPELPVVLMIGGSRGAAPMNKAVEKILPELRKANIQLIFQTGKKLFEQYKHYDNEFVRVLPFIDNMLEAYAASDLVVSRAGAMSFTEIALLGKPAILVPDPNFEQDHQTKNAAEIVKENAAVLVKETELQDKLWPAIQKIINDKTLQNQLRQNIKKMAFPNAAGDIAEDIVEHLRKTKKI